MPDNFDVIVIGGGPAGMMSAIMASDLNAKVLLLEKNEKLGKKLYITGKGRCNLTNADSIENHLQNIINGKKFMISALNQFSPDECINFFNSLGLKTKTERGKRVFPQSDKSSDVIKVLTNKLKNNNVKINLNEEVVNVIKKDNHFIVSTILTTYTTYSVIICCGGLSYPMTGSTGFGLEIAKKHSHNIISTVPALVSFLLKDNVSALAGLTLKNVKCAIKKDKILAQEFGELLFTHIGVSGPVALTLSSFVNRADLKNSIFSIDLKPALDYEKLNEKLIREFESFKNKNLFNYLKTLLPIALIDIFVSRIGIEKSKAVSDINKAQREQIIKTLKSFDFTIDNLDNIKNAVVTSGGVDLKEIDPKTMQSKLVRNLYFAGEVLDIDALTGGFNLQVAFSTGYVAGINAAKVQKKE